MKSLFADKRASWIWLVVRIYVGWTWLTSGWSKVRNPAWTGEDAGKSLTNFLTKAIDKDIAGWYSAFLENFVLPRVEVWSYVVAYGELLVGAALILGLLTAAAAFLGLFMNTNFLLAGALGSNPLLFLLSLALILAWRVSGHIGLDRWVLPKLFKPNT